MRPEWQVICEVSDDEAVLKARTETGFDFVGHCLPNNGIEAARRIRPTLSQLQDNFLSMNNSLDVVQVSLSAGGHGYVYKPAPEDLLPAIDAVLRGEQFVSSTLRVVQVTVPRTEGPSLHEVLFYSDDAVFLGQLCSLLLPL